MASRIDTQHQEMASKETMTLRVILTEADIRKFQDPEFNNELCNLTVLSELSQKPTVKIILVIELVPLSSGEMETSSDMLSDAPSTADIVLTSELPQEKRMP
ncbi:uncharacterized protein LOC113645414 isoform X1, partial [Tachysurus ichikawai]